MGFAVKVPGRGNAPGKPQRGDINIACVTTRKAPLVRIND